MQWTLGSNAIIVDASQLLNLTASVRRVGHPVETLE